MKENPITIRKAGLRARIQAYAEHHGLKFNVAAVTLIEAGLPKVRAKRRALTPPKDVLAKAEAAAAPLAPAKPLDTSSVPFNPPRAPMQKTKGRWSLGGVTPPAARKV